MAVELIKSPNIVPPRDRHLIFSEVNALPATQLLLQQGSYALYVATAEQIPETLHEIGRLREITFRAVGEGTGREIDIDIYDRYYWQLFIWDRAHKRIVGGYRMGEGETIYRDNGLDGFYISSLFVIDEGFASVLKQSIELGRSFVVEDYQKKHLPLFLLWKGILYFLTDRHWCRYLIGPVSISKYYSDLSKSLIVAFVMKRYYADEYAKYIKPRKPYRVHLDDAAIHSALESLSDIEALENFIEHIEPEHIRLPVLLKQYIRQNARFIGFNLDPNFSDALDGLMLLDLRHVRTEIVEKLKKSWQQ